MRKQQKDIKRKIYKPYRKYSGLKEYLKKKKKVIKIPKYAIRVEDLPYKYAKLLLSPWEDKEFLYNRLVQGPIYTLSYSLKKRIDLIDRSKFDKSESPLEREKRIAREENYRLKEFYESKLNRYNKTRQSLKIFISIIYNNTYRSYFKLFKILKKQLFKRKNKTRKLLLKKKFKKVIKNRKEFYKKRIIKKATKLLLSKSNEISLYVKKHKLFRNQIIPQDFVIPIKRTRKIFIHKGQYNADRILVSLEYKEFKNLLYKTFGVYLKNNKRVYKSIRKILWWQFYEKGRRKGKQKFKFSPNYHYNRELRLVRRTSLKLFYLLANRYLTTYNLKSLGKGYKFKFEKKKLKFSKILRRLKLRIKQSRKKKQKISEERLFYKTLRRSRNRIWWKRKFIYYKRLYVMFCETKNNFLITCTDRHGTIIYHVNAGSAGFKGPKKTFNHAAFMSGKKMRQYLWKSNIRSIAIMIKSRILHKSKLGDAIRGFMTPKIKIVRIISRIPCTHNGVRLQKPRRN